MVCVPMHMYRMCALWFSFHDIHLRSADAVSYRNLPLMQRCEGSASKCCVVAGCGGVKKIIVNYRCHIAHCTQHNAHTLDAVYLIVPHSNVFFLLAGGSRKS